MIGRYRVRSFAELRDFMLGVDRAAFVSEAEQYGAELYNQPRFHNFEFMYLLKDLGVTVDFSRQRIVSIWLDIDPDGPSADYRRYEGWIGDGLPNAPAPLSDVAGRLGPPDDTETHRELGHIYELRYVREGIISLYRSKPEEKQTLGVVQFMPIDWYEI